MMVILTTTSLTSTGTFSTNFPKSDDVETKYIESLRDCLYDCSFPVGAFYLSPIIILSWLRSSKYLIKNLTLCLDL